MAYEFRLPDIGEGVAEGEVVKWFVKEGDSVNEDAPLVSVLTDKANVEIPSPKTGKVLKIHAQVGEKVKVGGLLITIDAGGSAPAPATAPAASPAASSASPTPAPASPPPATASRPILNTGSPTTGRILATPQARRRATELGVDLARVRGSGPNGRITDTDVNAAAKSTSARAAEATPTAATPAPAESPAAPTQSETPTPPVPVAASSSSPAAPPPSPPTPAPDAPTSPAPAAPASAPAPASPARPDTVDVERIPIRGLRRVIAEHMATANQRAALFTYVEEIDATELVRFRERMAKHVDGDGVKLSYLPFILKGVVQGLRQYPWMNATVDDEKQEIVVHHRFHLGIATSTPDGLLVPVLRDVDTKSLTTLAKEIQGLAERGRAGTLTRTELSGSSFTITSLGALGGVLATPIVNYPEVAILGVHRIVKRPIYAPDGTIVPAQLMNLSVSLDHRVLDGVTGAQFLAVVKSYLEDPHRLFAEMA